MTPCVLLLIVANVALFFLQGRLPELTFQLELVPAQMLSRPWTLATYSFLHGSMGHIFFNMLGLWFFGPRLESHLGSSRFCGLYLASGICGGLLSYPFSPHAHIVGASGAVLGVLFGFARYWPHTPVAFWFVPTEARVLVIVFTVMDLFGGIGLGDGGIAHFAHLGGFIGAYLYLRVLERRTLRARFHSPWEPPKASKPPKPSADELSRWSKINRDALHEVNREEYDRIMEKIRESGVANLTSRERQFLDTFSDR